MHNMKTFQDLMREYPVAVTQNTGAHKGTNDVITRWYNLYWGALTDTHMQLLDDGTYLVTSSRLSPDMWNNIMYCRVLRTAPGTTLPHNWYEVMKANKMDYTYTQYNGAFAVALAISEENKSGELQIPLANAISSDNMGCCDQSC